MILYSLRMLLPKKPPSRGRMQGALSPLRLVKQRGASLTISVQASVSLMLPGKAAPKKLREAVPSPTGPSTSSSKGDVRSAAAATSMRSSGAAASKMVELTAAAAALAAAVAAAAAAFFLRLFLALFLALFLGLLLGLCSAWRAASTMAQALQTVQRLPLGLVSKEARGSSGRHRVQTCLFWQPPSLHLLSPEQACVGVQKERNNVTCGGGASQLVGAGGAEELTGEADACKGGKKRKEKDVA